MIAIAAFVIGVMVGCSSWLLAAAWLEINRRPREKDRRGRRRLAKLLPWLGGVAAQRA